MLDAWRYLIPDIPDGFDWVVWLFLALVLAAGVRKWIKSRREAEERPDSIVRKLQFGVGGPTICLIYYEGGGFTETYATEHAKTLSWSLPLYLEKMRAAYADAHGVNTTGNVAIHHVVVKRDLDEGINGRIRLYPDGAVVLLRAFKSHHDSGAWGWELRNYVRHYEGGVYTGGEAEFDPVVEGDDAAEIASSQYRRRP
jgi:hypothetical protein